MAVVTAGGAPNGGPADLAVFLHDVNRMIDQGDHDGALIVLTAAVAQLARRVEELEAVTPRPRRLDPGGAKRIGRGGG